MFPILFSPEQFSPDGSVRVSSVPSIQSQIYSVPNNSVLNTIQSSRFSPKLIQSQTIQSQDTSVPEFSVHKFSVPANPVLI